MTGILFIFLVYNIDSSLGDSLLPKAKRLSWPVEESARLTQEFRAHGRRHDGIDLAAPMGSTIFAAHDGIVLYSGREFSGYGKMLLIETSNGWASLYSHCQRLLVSSGQIVKRGQKIALMGKTGNARGVHLHFELRYRRTPVDPLKYLP